MKLSNDGTSVTGSKISISCDCLGVAGGWTPAVHLYTQSGSKLKFDEEKQIFFIYPEASHFTNTSASQVVAPVVAVHVSSTCISSSPLK